MKKVECQVDKSEMQKSCQVLFMNLATLMNADGQHNLMSNLQMKCRIRGGGEHLFRHTQLYFHIWCQNELQMNKSSTDKTNKSYCMWPKLHLFIAPPLVGRVDWIPPTEREMWGLRFLAFSLAVQVDIHFIQRQRRYLHQIPRSCDQTKALNSHRVNPGCARPNWCVHAPGMWPS